MITDRFRSIGLPVALLVGLAASWAVGAPAEKAAPREGAEEGPAKEQSIYIPYEKLRETFEREGRGVFLPYEQFLELWRASRREAPEVGPEAPPVDALVAEVENTATVSEDVVSVRSIVRVEVLKKGWTQVPLRLGDAAITRATLDGKPARLVFDAEDGYRLLVEKEGEKPALVELGLEFAKAYTKAPGQNSVSFECPQAPVSRWEIHIPERGVKVNIEPLLAATEVPGDEKAGETVVLAFVGAARTVRINWTPKAEGARGLEALATVRATQEVVIDEGVTRTRARLAYAISRAELGRLVVEVPADQKIVNVYDPNVREWSVEPAGDMQRVTVDLFEPAKETQNLAVDLEKFTAGEAIEVRAPVVRAVGVGRQQGSVAVRVAEGLRAEAVTQTGLLQVDPGDLPRDLARGGCDFAYRYAALPFELVLSVEKIQPRLLADSLVEVHLEPESLSMLLTSVFTVERAGVFHFAVRLPDGYDVRDVAGVAAGDAAAAQVDGYDVEEGKPRRLRVNLSRKALGRVGLVVRLHRALNEPDLLAPTGRSAHLALEIPRVDPESVERETGHVVVYAPESIRVNPETADGLRSVSFAEARQGISGGGAGGTERPVLAFAFTQEPVGLAVAAERRKPHVTARQLLVAGIESGVVKYDVTFFYSIRYSGLKSLRIDVPAALAGDIRNVTGGVNERVVEPAPADVAEGYVAWRLTGETEFFGETRVRFVWEKKIDKLDVGERVYLPMPRLVPRDVDRAWGQIVLTKGETIDVRESDREADVVEGLRPIDPQHDLMPGAQVKEAARAFEFHDVWLLTVVATRYEPEEVKHTSIERAVVRMVVTRDSKTSVQALYRMRSARQRLAIELPEGVGFDSQPLRLNGLPVTLERGEKGRYFVPLVGQNPDRPFLLELRYTLASGSLRMDCPTFPMDPAVQKVYLVVYLPGEWSLLGSMGPWTAELWWPWPHFGVRPRAVQDDGGLTAWVGEGVGSSGGPADTFHVGGRQYVFSALRPASPPAGSLRVVAMDCDWLHGLVFAVILAGGLVLAPMRAVKRWLAAGGFVVVMIVLGVFCPTFVRQAAGGAMFAALAIVLVVWVVWYVAWTRPRDPAVRERKEARRRARLVRIEARGAGSVPPPPVDVGPEAGAADEGGEADA